MNDSHETLEIKCCSQWVQYPRAGHDTECPECHSTFTMQRQSRVCAMCLDPLDDDEPGPLHVICQWECEA